MFFTNQTPHFMSTIERRYIVKRQTRDTVSSRIKHPNTKSISSPLWTGWFTQQLEVRICFWSSIAWPPTSCTWAFPLSCSILFLSSILVLYGQPPSTVFEINKPPRGIRVYNISLWVIGHFNITLYLNELRVLGWTFIHQCSLRWSLLRSCLSLSITGVQSWTYLKLQVQILKTQFPANVHVAS